MNSEQLKEKSLSKQGRNGRNSHENSANDIRFNLSLGLGPKNELVDKTVDNTGIEYEFRDRFINNTGTKQAMKERRKRRNEDGNKSLLDDGSISNFGASKRGTVIKEVNESQY